MDKSIIVTRYPRLAHPELVEGLAFAKPGFSLLEIIVAMAIVAVMATQLPRLTRINYTHQEKCIANLNMLARNAYAHALISGRPTQIFFDFESNPKKVSIRVETDKKAGSENKPVFELIKSEYGNESFEWDDRFEIEKFIIDGKDEAGGTVKTIWFYIMPDGLAQQVTLVLRDQELGVSIELVLNPFFVQFVEN